ncbi:MAG: hypothetical protein M3Z16_09100 [Pseudomonadota bacterium]|nr:hypothetical protein [Pseudomonadota bacterium]
MFRLASSRGREGGKRQQLWLGRAIAASLRHCYPEPWRGGGEFSLDQHALDLTTFIRQVASQRVHLVGYSRGQRNACFKL